VNDGAEGSPPDRRGKSPAADGREFSSVSNRSGLGPDGIHESWRVYEREGNPCVICDGTGENKCLYCFGDGVVYIGAGGERDRVDCPQCGGQRVEVCPRCKGSGVRPSTRIDLVTLKVGPNRTNRDVIDGTYPEGYTVRNWGPVPPVYAQEDGAYGAAENAEDSEERESADGAEAEDASAPAEPRNGAAGASVEERDAMPTSAPSPSAHR
jgi:hypothetical protein